MSEQTDTCSTCGSRLRLAGQGTADEDTCPICGSRVRIVGTNFYCPYTGLEPPQPRRRFSKGFSCYACGFVGMIPVRDGDGQ